MSQEKISLSESGVFVDHVGDLVNKIWFCVLKNVCLTGKTYQKFIKEPKYHFLYKRLLPSETKHAWKCNGILHYYSNMDMDAFYGKLQTRYYFLLSKDFKKWQDTNYRAKQQNKNKCIWKLGTYLWRAIGFINAIYWYVLPHLSLKGSKSVGGSRQNGRAKKYFTHYTALLYTNI